jgi:uncharacterized protein YeaC (DUF1315 family)
MEEIKKLDDNKIEIETTETKSEVIDIDTLIYDKDSLERTIEANIVEMTKVNTAIQNQIDEIDAKLTRAKELGVKTDGEILAQAQLDSEAQLKKMYEENPPVDVPDEPVIEGEIVEEVLPE